MRRALVVALLATLLIPGPARADGGTYLAGLVASATGVGRTYDATLDSVARARSAEISANWPSSMTHRPLVELTNAGWSYGEVIADNAGYATEAESYAAAVAGWMGSSLHAVILTDPIYTRIGCDHRTASGRHFYVCIVGIPPGGPPPEGEPIVGELPDTAMKEP